MKNKRQATLRASILAVLVNLVFTSTTAISMQDFHAKGLPTNAEPASYYFKYNMDTAVKPQVTERDIYESSYWGNEITFFFVEPQNRKDDDFGHVNIWFYKENDPKARCLLKQDVNNHDDLFFYNLELAGKKQAHDSIYYDATTQQRLTMQKWTIDPIVVLYGEIWCGTGHAIRTTMIIDTTNGKIVRKDHESFVGIFHTQTRMLMMAECELAQDYIITTTTEIRTEDEPFKETEDMTLFIHQYLTPVVKFYSVDGELVKTLRLPEDKIDMVR